MYVLYILECSDKTLYTGITRDLNRRLKDHNSTNNGARYTLSRRPVQIVYKKEFPNKTEALREEIRIKRLSREEKLNFIGLV
jgi:putative endonuclease